jgi:hypothetical protein
MFDMESRGREDDRLRGIMERERPHWPIDNTVFPWTQCAMEIECRHCRHFPFGCLKEKAMEAGNKQEGEDNG